MQEYLSTNDAIVSGCDLKTASNILMHEISQAIDHFHNSYCSPETDAVNNCIDDLYDAVTRLEQHALCLINVTTDRTVIAERRFMTFMNKEIHGSPKEILQNYFHNTSRYKDVPDHVDVDDEEAVLDVLDDIGYWITDYKIL